MFYFINDTRKLFRYLNKHGFDVDKVKARTTGNAYKFLPKDSFRQLKNLGKDKDYFSIIIINSLFELKKINVFLENDASEECELYKCFESLEQFIDFLEVEYKAFVNSN